MPEQLGTFHYQIPTRISFGVGVIAELPKVVGEYSKNVLFLSMRELPAAAKVRDLLLGQGCILTEFYDIEPNPSTTTVDKAAALARAAGCGAIVAVGGGSVIDTAKAASIVMTHEGGAWDYTVDMGDKRKIVSHPTLPIIAVPTTAGTGSEVTQNSLVTNPETKRKAPIRSPYICPSQAFVDPELMVSMPARITAATGFDAFTHAFEKYFGPKYFPYIDVLAFDAMATVVANLERALTEPGNLEVRGSMAWASTQSALCVLAEAFESGLHVFSLPISGLFGVAHGEALALCMPFTLDELIRLRPERVARLAELFFPAAELEGLGVAERCGKCSLGMADWLGRIGLRHRLGDYGITRDDLPALARNTSVERLTNAWERRITEEDVVARFSLNL